MTLEHQPTSEEIIAEFTSRVAANQEAAIATPTTKVPLEKLFQRALAAAEQCRDAGVAISPESLHFNSNRQTLSVVQAKAVLSTPKFRTALEQRGIPLDPMAELTPQQRYGLAIYFDASVTTSHAAKLKMIGATSLQWDGWLKQPLFAAYVSEASAMMLQRAVPIATQRLTELADQGNVKAIDRVLAWTRTYDHRKTQDVDVQALLQGIFEVLDENHVDSAILSKVADKVTRLNALASAAGQAMLNPNQVTPGTALRLEGEPN